MKTKKVKTENVTPYIHKRHISTGKIVSGSLTKAYWQMEGWSSIEAYLLELNQDENNMPNDNGFIWEIA